MESRNILLKTDKWHWSFTELLRQVRLHHHPDTSPWHDSRLLEAGRKPSIICNRLLQWHSGEFTPKIIHILCLSNFRAHLGCLRAGRYSWCSANDTPVTSWLEIRTFSLYFLNHFVLTILRWFGMLVFFTLVQVLRCHAHLSYVSASRWYANESILSTN